MWQKKTGEIMLGDDCDDTCDDCASNTFNIPQGVCLYTKPIDADEWYLFMDEGACGDDSSSFATTLSATVAAFSMFAAALAF
jgi:hypothetical protein